MTFLREKVIILLLPVPLPCEGPDAHQTSSANEVQPYLFQKVLLFMEPVGGGQDAELGRSDPCSSGAVDEMNFEGAEEGVVA